MRPLMMCLWTVGVLCCLGVVGLFLPMSVVSYLSETVVHQPLPETAAMAYMFRAMCATYVAIGVFYLILAVDPMAYGALVPFSGAAAIFVGVACGLFGLISGVAPLWFGGDFLVCTAFGLLILIFWRRALARRAEAARPQQRSRRARRGDRGRSSRTD